MFFAKVITKIKQFRHKAFILMQKIMPETIYSCREQTYKRQTYKRTTSRQIDRKQTDIQAENRRTYRRTYKQKTPLQIIMPKANTLPPALLLHLVTVLSIIKKRIISDSGYPSYPKRSSTPRQSGSLPPSL